MTANRGPDRGDTIRRHYPSRPVEPHEYAAWRAVLERAARNGWYCGPDDRADTIGAPGERPRMGTAGTVWGMGCCERMAGRIVPLDTLR